jgi:hypothetical protein
MEYKGTTGKWEISTNNEEGILISTNPMSRDICTIWKYDNNFLENQEAKANALLISKAPKLLKFINEIYDEWCETGISSVRFDNHMNNAKQLIKEATEL